MMVLGGCIQNILLMLSQKMSEKFAITQYVKTIVPEAFSGAQGWKTYRGKGQEGLEFLPEDTKGIIISVKTEPQTSVGAQP